MPRLTIDGREIEVPAGTKVIDAAEKLGIYIPRFCYLRPLGAVGACRVCAVRISEGEKNRIDMSCMVESREGMVVSTTDPEAVDFRRHVIEWLMMNHPHDCPVCDEGGQCLLQDMTESGGHFIRRFPGHKRTYNDQYLGPFIQHEMNRCIQCYRCSRFYKEYAGYRDLGVMQIANRVYYGRIRDGALESPFSGNLVDICPVGVYTDKPARYKARRWDMVRSPSLCPHCSLACATVANVYNRALIRVEAAIVEDESANFICDRGRFGSFYASIPERPRLARVGAAALPPEDALAAAAEQLDALVRRHGPEAVACLGSGRASLETLSMLKRLCRARDWPDPVFFIDPGLRARTISAVAGLRKESALSLRDVESADLILAVGVDPVNEAPMLALAMRQAFRKGAKVVVLDPRPVFLPLEFLHLPATPADIDACLAGLVRALARPAAPEAPQPSSLDAACADLAWERDLPPSLPAGHPLAASAQALSSVLAASHHTAIVCGVGASAQAAPGLAARLARAVSGAGLLYALASVNDFGAAMLDAGPRSFDDVVAAIERGEVRALVAVESDPLAVYPDRPRLLAALDRLDLLVAMDVLPSETAAHAHVFLPSATHYEVASTFINHEGKARTVGPAFPGGAPLAQASGGGHPPRMMREDIPGAEPRASWLMLQNLARSLAALDAGTAGVQPWLAGADEAPAFTPLAHGSYPYDNVQVLPGGFSPAVAAVAPPPAPPAPATAAGLEVILADLTFGSEELSRYSPAARAAEPEPAASMHEDDAARLALADGDMVEIMLPRGVLRVRLRAPRSMARSVLVLPRHRALAWQLLDGFTTFIPLAAVRRAP